MSRRVLFVHDGPVYVDSKRNYYWFQSNDILHERYFHFGSYLTLLTRVQYWDKNKLSILTQIDGVNVSVIHLPNYKSICLFFRNYLKARSIIKKAVLEHDIILCRLPSASGTLAAKAALRLNKPLLVEYVACTFNTYWNYDWRGKVIANYKRIQQRRLMKAVPYTIYVTQEYLQKGYPTKGNSINCSDVELGYPDPEVLQERLLKIEDMDLSAPVSIGTIAALDIAYKGQADVIKALFVLKMKGKLFRYHLIGPGDPNKLYNLANKLGLANEVHIQGQIGHSEVFKFLKAIDIYMQPSKTEGLPRALIEAMSTACPAFGSRVGGIPELIDEKMLFEAGNTKEIINKLYSLNKKTLKEQAVRNFNEAKFYQKQVINDRRLEFYKRFLSDYF